MTLFNGSGQVVDADYAYTWLDNLPAGEKTCFDITLSQPPDWAYYEFGDITHWPGRTFPNLAILNDTGALIHFNWYRITGQVRNDHGSVVKFVQPVGTLYNAAGKVIGCWFDFTDPADLNPGQVGTFEMTFLGRDYSDVASYRLQADGDPQ